MNDSIVLKPKRDKPVRQGHPWIFSGAIRQIPESAVDGSIVSVVDSGGNWLAKGYLNRKSQICVRLLSWQEDEQIDEGFWHQRLAASVARRQDLADDPQTNVYRLVNAESDYLPGLTVDRYGAHLVLQSGTLGIDRRKVALAEQLMTITGCSGVIERSEATVRRREGLDGAVGLLAGAAPEATVQVMEHGFQFLVDLTGGQKTGFYADQRENRRRVAAYCAGKRVLNAFSYTGAFGIYALAAGADHVINVDTSADALTLGRENARLNGFDDGCAGGFTQNVTEDVTGDVFQVLRGWRGLSRSGTGADQGPQFDVIVLDPPKFAQSKRNIDRALRGYKDINLLAMQLLSPGGILATFSCSGLVSADLFQKVVFGAAVDAERPVQVVEWLRQSADHPVAITFPEGEYLKGLICRVL